MRAAFDVRMNHVEPSAERLQITYRDFSSTETLETRVRERAEELFALFPKLTTCRVVLEEPHRRHRHGRKFRCRVDLVVPNGELVAQNAEESDTSEDLYVTVEQVFDEAKRELERYVQRARWDVKRHDGTPHARVVKLMVGEGPGTRYGFLETHDGREIYFHENAVLHGHYDRLAIGTEVRFAEEEGDKGPQASTVAATKRRTTLATSTDLDVVPASRA